jgi:hypothetical protein
VTIAVNIGVAAYASSAGVGPIETTAVQLYVFVFNIGLLGVVIGAISRRN